MAEHHDDDLVASKTEGFKVGEKKTLEEYKNLGKGQIFPCVENGWRLCTSMAGCLEASF